MALVTRHSCPRGRSYSQPLRCGAADTNDWEMADDWRAGMSGMSTWLDKRSTAVGIGGVVVTVLGVVGVILGVDLHSHNSTIASLCNSSVGRIGQQFLHAAASDCSSANAKSTGGLVLAVVGGLVAIVALWLTIRSMASGRSTVVGGMTPAPESFAPASPSFAPASTPSSAVSASAPPIESPSPAPAGTPGILTPQERTTARPRFCAACGAGLPGDARFCAGCGTAVQP